MATENNIQEIQCGRIGPNATSIGFIFAPTVVYLSNDIRRVCYVTNPTRNTEEYTRDNHQIRVVKGEDPVIIMDDGDDRSVYVTITDDGMLKFVDRNGDAVVFSRSDAYDFIAIRTSEVEA